MVNIKDIEQILRTGGAILCLFCIVLMYPNKAHGQNDRVTELVSWNGRLPEVGISKLIKGPSDRLWIGTEGRGLFVWNGQDLKAIDGLGSTFVSDLLFWKGDLYIATDQGAFIVRGWPVKPVKLPWEIGFPTLLAGGKDTSLFVYDPIGGLREYSEGFRKRESISTPIDISSIDYHESHGLIAVSEEALWSLSTNEWAKFESLETGLEDHNLLWLEGNKNLLFRMGIRPDARTIAVSGDHFWAVSNSGLWHSYPDTSIVSFLEPWNDLPLEESPSVQDKGLILDKARMTNDEWMIASETGLFMVTPKGVKAIDLPVNDPFSFSVKLDGSDMWIGNGEALLFNSNIGSWISWDVQGVTDILPDGAGNAWVLDFVGNVRRVDSEGRVGENIIENDASLIGLFRIGKGEYALNESGMARKLTSPDSLYQLFPQTLSPISRLEYQKGKLALNSALAISIFDCTQELRAMGSLRRGIDYFQKDPELDLVWFNSDELAVKSWDGWKVWNVHEISTPSLPVIDEIQLAVENNLLVDSNSFRLNTPKFDLPYYSSFLQLHLRHSVHMDNRRWGFRYILKQNEKLVAEETVGSDVIFPALSPGSYTLELYSRDNFSGLLSQPGVVQFRVTPPVWQQPLFIVLSIVGLLLIVAAIAFFRIRRIREENRMQTELSRLEGMALRLQMNPHFIFNALDSISNFIFSNKQEEAIHYLSSFAKLIRNTLESAHEHQITIRTEVDILKSYLELESMRNSRRLEYVINCDEELMEDYAIPPLIIQPYVENAVKHGLKPRKGEGKISVDFAEKGDMLIVVVEDDGIGRMASEEMKKKQMGMLKKKSMSMGITQQRLELLKQAWNERVSVHIKDLVADDGTPEGTRVEVRLPLIEAEWSDGSE